MLDKFIYENHIGERYEGIENGVYLNYSDLRDYVWECDTINSRISRFYRPIKTRTLPLVIVGKNGTEATATKNKLTEIAEKDIEAMIPGKIIVGDYYTRGYITGSAKSNYLINKRHCKLDLTFLSEDPAWYREQPHSFFPGVNDVVVNSGTDYPYDYAFDYAAGQSAHVIVCESIRPNAFTLRIYGDVENPTITVGGHVYSINGTIAKGESLLIDSMTKTITLTKEDGTKENWFDKRSRESYIFQEIPSGQHTVIWNDSFGFDLTIIEKRSEPKWI